MEKGVERIGERGVEKGVERVGERVGEKGVERGVATTNTNSNNNWTITRQ